MKRTIKYISALLLIGAGMPMMAQTEETAPNRLLILDNNGNLYGGYSTDYIQDIRFATVEGPVLAEVEILKVESNEKVFVTIVRTPSCESFRFSVLPSAMAMPQNDAALISYVENYGTDKYYQDFTSGETAITGINLDYSTSYCVVTVGYDPYGIAAGVYRAEFMTPDPEIIGVPYVDAKIDELTNNYFTITFTPNADVLEYYPVSFKGGEGQAMRDFLSYGGMMGYPNVNEMIAGFTWNNPRVGVTSVTWDNMDPGTDYEVAIAVKDLDGYFTPEYQTVLVRTLSNGGSGAAFVDIDFGDFYFSEWEDNVTGEVFMGGTQEVTFYPNENTNRYRWDGYLASDYDKWTNEINADLCSEPPYNIVGWWLFEPFYDELLLEPNNTYAIIAAGQNSENVWGEVNVGRITTPDITARASNLKKALPSKDGKVMSRILSKKVKNVESAQKGAKAPMSRELKKIGLEY